MKRSELFFTFILLPLDLAMFLLSFALAFVLRGHLETPFLTDFGLKTYLLYSIYLAPFLVLFFALNGLYNRRNYTGYWQEFYRVTIATSTTILLLIVAIFLSKSLFFSRLILVFTWISAIVLIFFARMILRAIERYFLKFGIGIRQVALVGNNEISKSIAHEMTVARNGSYHLAGIISPGDASAGEVKFLGDLDNLPAIISKYKIDELILTDAHLSRSRLLSIVQICEDNKIGFKYTPDLFGLFTASFRPGLVGSIPVMELKNIPLDGWGRISKRIFDILFSLLFLIVFSPVYLILALLVKLTSKGPVFYKQDRIGRDEQKFELYKFRSMYLEQCDFQGGEKWTTAKDNETRITPFGRILRKTNLDELPQIWNIFLGEMSFVGPRPEQPKLVEKFEKEIPEYFRRHKVKSGLTGWAQVNGLKGDTSIRDRVRYDIYYIENWSLFIDLKILFKTIGLIAYEAINGKSEYRHRS